jgi:hypothetical protein
MGRDAGTFPGAASQPPPVGEYSKCLLSLVAFLVAIAALAISFLRR